MTGLSDRPNRAIDPLSLRLLLLVDDAGSIAEAARRADMAASAVSKRLSDLEARFGLSLLERSAGGVSLTAAGKTVARHGEHVLGLLERLEADVAEHAIGRRGEVRMAGVTSAIIGPLPEDLATFEAEQSTVRVWLKEAHHPDVIRQVVDGVIDIGIVADQHVPRALTKRDYATDPIWVIGPKGHSLFQGVAEDKAIPFAEAVQHEWIAMETGGALSELLMAAASMIDKPVKKRMEVNRFDSLRRLVEAGHGIGFLRQASVEPFLGSMEIEGRPLNDTWAGQSTVIIARDPAALTQASRALFDFLSRQAESRR
ncbi:MAG: LysR family transcriptional regulator [Magnetovibrionaceae bacterium]